MAIAILSVLLFVVCVLFLRAFMLFNEEKKEVQFFKDRAGQLWNEKQQLELRLQRTQSIIDDQNREIEKLQRELSRYQSAYWPLDDKERN